MGLRREEVDVTVVQEARSGILGVGRRQAVVKVSKKTGGGQQACGRRDSASDGNRRGRGQQAGERLDSGRGGRSGRTEERRGGRGRGGAQVETRETREALGRDGRDDKDSRDSRDSRSVRGRGGRGGARRGDQPAGEETRAAAATQDTPRDQAPAASREADQSAEANDSRSRRRRPRRRRKKSETEGQPQVARANGPTQSDEREAAAVVVDPVAVEQPIEKSPAGDVGEQVQVTATPPTSWQDTVEPAGAEPADDRTGDQPALDQEAAPAAQPATHDADGGKVLAADVAASARVAPLTAEEIAELPSLLQRVATELMVKSGFPCRVQVIEGEYHLVKLVVDDRSAGVLIGRYGNTVDAVEYLVEKLASKAAGDRVRMNLDINNYRLRREDQLVQRARNAAAEARNTGEPVAMEPAAGRERRIVHLYIQDTEDLTTYTEDHADGKYVVICRPDQVPEQHRQDGSDEDGEPAQPEIEVSAVIDVQTDSASRSEAERSD
jgi:spoIIIJ-associated protein